MEENNNVFKRFAISGNLEKNTIAKLRVRLVKQKPMFGNASYWQGIRLFLIGNSIELTDLENVKNEVYTMFKPMLPFYGVEPYETNPYN